MFVLTSVTIVRLIGGQTNDRNTAHNTRYSAWLSDTLTESFVHLRAFLKWDVIGKIFADGTSGSGSGGLAPY